MNKSFVKWVGGKQKSLKILNELLPENLDGYTYIEPFVGGGSMLINMIEKYPNINKFVVNDINKQLINCYKKIKDNNILFIEILNDLFKQYEMSEDQKEFYYVIRDILNEGELTPINEAAVFIFLNRTCFRGLYRVNSKGKFNSSFGHYGNNFLKDNFKENKRTITYLHELFNKVDIEFHSTDYKQIDKYIGEKTFIFIDPPYRPFNGGKSVQYDKDVWTDREQMDLFEWIHNINHYSYTMGYDFKFMTTNTYCDFIRDLYVVYGDKFNINSFDIKYCIEKSVGKEIEKSREVIIRNYN